MDVPVDPDGFADPDRRREWMTERNMQASGRPLDLDDARHLKWIADQQLADEGDSVDASD